MDHAEPIVVFGRAPDGVVCRERRAAYVVTFDARGFVHTVSGDAAARARQATPKYWLPGGGIEAGETPRQAIEREMQEELGCGVRVDRRLGRALQYFFAGGEKIWYAMTAELFAGEAIGDPRDAGDLLHHRLDPHAELDALFHECHAWAVRQAMDA